jgi:predicted DNA-binding transcriptional regulator AlpA
MKKKFYDAADLIAMDLFGSRMGVWRAVKEGRLAPGRMTSPNRRKWTEQEIDDYIASCPVERERERDAGAGEGEPEPIKRERKADTNAAGETDDDDSRDAEASARDSEPGRAA